LKGNKDQNNEYTTSTIFKDVKSETFKLTFKIDAKNTYLERHCRYEYNGSRTIFTIAVEYTITLITVYRYNKLYRSALQAD